ncbi:MAG: IS66 family insertion sequence element accessory protein TnpB [Bryobacterales bacterium]|nr:IS66 family insertion sequence element accessory protein TnpB [Bryobacterales bacterium]
MFALGPATEVTVATGARDVRKGFEGLYGLVRDELLADPLSGHLFLFANARPRLKLLFWDARGAPSRPWGWSCAYSSIAVAE